MWITELNISLNSGMLPGGYYALPEQHTGHAIADILTLHARPEEAHPLPPISDDLKSGELLPEMPLFLRRDRYINAPLESTYQAAWRGMPAFWRDVLEGHPPKGY